MAEISTLDPKTRMHLLIDRLTESEVERIEQILSFELAEFDDEGLTSEEIALINEGREDMDQGLTASLAEVRRRFRLAS